MLELLANDDYSPDDIYLPVSIFIVKELGVLEIIVKYLKEDQSRSNQEISVLLNRDNRTIWTTYNNSKKKYPGKLTIADGKRVPLSIFKDRKFGALELLTEYMKDKFHLKFVEIGQLISRNERTVWTSYNKAKKKRK